MDTKNVSHASPPPERRGFLKQVAAIAISLVTTIIPFGAGLAVFLDPARRKTAEGNFIKVARLTDLTKEGVPVRFPVVATKTDVWNKIPDAKIGAVYIMRTGPKPTDLLAFNVSCPHLGCAVEYKTHQLPPTPDKTLEQSHGFYFCPCHNSSFALDGKINDAKSPAKRGLDTLLVKVQGEDVLVEFKNFDSDKAEKIPVS